MELISSPGALSTTHFACGTCGCEWCHGLFELPDPERLRSEADHLTQIADEIEQADGLAGRLQEAFA